MNGARSSNQGIALALLTLGACATAEPGDSIGRTHQSLSGAIVVSGPDPVVAGCFGVNGTTPDTNPNAILTSSVSVYSGQCDPSRLATLVQSPAGDIAILARYGGPGNYVYHTPFLFFPTVGTYTITWSDLSGGYAPGSYTFTVIPGPAFGLGFQTTLTIPLGTHALPPIKVGVVDAYGNAIASSSATVTLAAGGPAGSTFSGTATQQTASGVATFSDWSATLPVSGQVTFTATAPSWTSATYSVWAGAYVYNATCVSPCMPTSAINVSWSGAPTDSTAQVALSSTTDGSLVGLQSTGGQEPGTASFSSVPPGTYTPVVLDKSAIVASAQQSFTVHPYVPLPTSLQSKIPVTGSRRIALDGDTLAVDNGNNAFDVFVRSGNVWTQQAELVGTGNVQLGGRSVALSGDWLVAEDTTFQGVVFFHRSGTTWTQESAIAQPTWLASLVNGQVGISGDTAIYCTDQNSVGATPVVLTRTGSTWSIQGTLAGTDATSGDRIRGGSISGDTITFETQSAVYLFGRSGSVWSQMLEAHAPAGDAETSVVDDATALLNSAIYVRSAGSWSLQQSNLTLTDPPPQLSGDILFSGNVFWVRSAGHWTSYGSFDGNVAFGGDLNGLTLAVPNGHEVAIFVPPSADGGLSDGGADAGVPSDAGSDASADAASDSGSETSTDGGGDAALDATLDAESGDTGSDASVDAAAGDDAAKAPDDGATTSPGNGDATVVNESDAGASPELSPGGGCAAAPRVNDFDGCASFAIACAFLARRRRRR